MNQPTIVHYYEKKPGIYEGSTNKEKITELSKRVGKDSQQCGLNYFLQDLRGQMLNDKWNG